MKQVLAALALLAVTATSVSAQTKGRVGIGGSVTFNHTADGDVSSVLTAGPLVRLTPHEGWGPAGAFNWFEADLEGPGGTEDFARLRIRPLMAGVSYSVARGNLMTSFSIVAGPSFNRARFDKVATIPGGASIDAENSFAFRPGVGLTYTVAPRVAIVGFGGYLVNRPDVVYRDGAGNELRDRWKADAVVVSVGAVYSIF